MTLFKLFLQSTGLSTREAARFLNVSPDTVKSWSSGRNNCPDGVLDEMSELINRQNRFAKEIMDIIEKKSGIDEIGYCTDDHEAQGLGLPTKSTHDAVIRRVIECVDKEIREDIILAPLVSTVLAIAAHKK